MRGMKVIAAPAGILGLAASGAAQALEWYFQAPASGMARDIDLLHQYVMWLIIVIFVAHTRIPGSSSASDGSSCSCSS